jgi:MFS family permease
VQPQFQSLEERNDWNLYVEVAWFGVLAGIANTFLAVFALRLGASNLQVGLLTSLPALIMVLVSIPGARLVEGQRRIMPFILLTGFLHRFGYFLLALVPFFFLVEHQAEAVVVLVALLTVPMSMATVAFTSMMADVVAPSRRAQVVSVRNVLVGLTSTGAALAGGKFLELLPLPLNYQALFALAFLASLLSLYYLARIEMPETGGPDQGQRADGLLRLRLGDLAALLSSSPTYVRFTLSSFVFFWGLFFPIPLYTIYWVRNLQITDWWVGLLSTVGNAAMVASFLFWGRWTGRRGNRQALLLSTVGLALYPILTAFSFSVEPLIYVSILGGVFTAGFNLTLFNSLLEVCPDQRRPSFIASYNSLVNVPAFVAPLLGTAAVGWIGIHQALLLGGVLRFLGVFLFYRWHRPSP